MRIQLYKHPDTLHYGWPLLPLGEDLEGRWYGAPAGTIWTKGDLMGSFHADLLCLVPFEAWWLAEFFRESDGVRIYVHVCTPPRVEDDCISSVDLDLDVEVSPGAGPELLDEDEFRANSASLAYPPNLIANAADTAREMMHRLRDPFPWTQAALEQWYPALEEALAKNKEAP